MKTILFSFCLMITVFSASAFSPSSTDPAVELTKKLSDIITASSIWEEASENQSIIVSFTINENGELVILSTNNNVYDAKLKGLLNYRRINTNPVLVNRIFHLPIKIKPEGI